jgi:hypothetical protein
MSTTNISRSVSQNGETGGRSTSEPIRSKSLITEDRSKTVSAQSSGGTISEEFENESDFRESSENTGDVECEFGILLLIVNESIVFEFLEDFVVYY